MIQSMCYSSTKCVISKDNDLLDLEAKLKQYPKETHKIVAFENIYFMCDSIGPIKEICNLAEQSGTLTFLNEVYHIENDASGSHCWPVLSLQYWCHQTSGS